MAAAPAQIADMPASESYRTKADLDLDGRINGTEAEGSSLPRHALDQVFGDSYREARRNANEPKGERKLLAVLEHLSS